jgi:hypothetical protein
MFCGTALSWTTKAWVPVHALAWDFPFFGHLDSGLGISVYNGALAVLVNFVVAAVLSLLIRSNAPDETAPADYLD